MKVFKRIFTSITRKPQQSILMFLIVFMLGNVLFASIAIKHTSEDVRMELRSRVPSNIVLEQKEHLTAYESRKIIKFYSELIKNENIKNIEVITYLFIESATLFDKSLIPKINMIESLEGYISNNLIAEGRFFTQEELAKGSNKIVLSSSEFKEKDHNGEKYKIGGVYRVYLYDYEIYSKNTIFGAETFTTPKELDKLTYVDYEIIGCFVANDFDILASVETCIPQKSADTLVNIQNRIIEAHSEQENKLYEESNTNYEVTKNIEKIIIYTKGIDANRALNEEIRSNENFDTKLYSVYSSEADYSYIEAPLENLIALTNVALIGSVIMIILLLSLVSMLFIRTRTKEIGILMALGERKITVLMQFVLELVLVGLLSTSCAVITGQKLAEYVSQEFMKIQIDVDAESEYAEKNPGEVTHLDLLDTYHVEMSSEYIVQIYLASFTILAISSVVPVLIVLNIKPKKVLL